MTGGHVATGTGAVHVVEVVAVDALGPVGPGEHGRQGRRHHDRWRRRGDHDRKQLVERERPVHERERLDPGAVVSPVGPAAGRRDKGVGPGTGTRRRVLSRGS